MEDDEQLVRQIRDGDERAAAFLVSLHAPRLAAYARDVASDLSDTDRQLVCDIAIETAIKRIDRFDHQRGSLARWLRPFVRNAARDWRRTNGHMVEMPDVLPEQMNEPNLQDEQRTAAFERVAGAVRQLSDTDQLIIALRDRESLTYREIAYRLDVDEAACRQRHRRAISRLAKALEHDDIVLAALRRTSTPHRPKDATQS